MNAKSFKASLITALLALVMAPAAVVAASSTEISFASATGTGQSATRVMINNILVSFVTTNPFDPSHPSIQSVAYNVPFEFDATTLHLVPSLGGAVDTTNTATLCASLTVNVSNASTGSALSGAVITVGSGTATTNDSGVATLSGLAAGTATVSATAANYTSTSRTITLSCTTSNSAGIAMSPSSGTGAISANQVRIVLNWGADPRDLDSHLTGPSSASDGSLTDTTNRFHVYYPSSSRTAETTLAVLDTDDTSGFGPETITISPPSGGTVLRPGLYRYSVYHFSGSSTIPNSGASVTLYTGSQQQEFSPPASTAVGASGALWTVFELGVDASGAITVYPVNTYSTASSSTVRSTETGYGDIERGVDFARLPPK